MTVGQVIDVNARARSVRADRVVVTPSGQRLTQVPGEEPNASGIVELSEQGFYEVRDAGTAAAGRPEAVAVNIDPAESDLAPLDPGELVASVTGHAGQVESSANAAEATVTLEETERRQSLWWYLMLSGLLLLAAETAIANRLSRREKFL
jgi:hypothetical protein